MFVPFVEMVSFHQALLAAIGEQEIDHYAKLMMDFIAGVRAHLFRGERLVEEQLGCLIQVLDVVLRLNHWRSSSRAGAWRPPPEVDLSLPDYPGLGVMLKKTMTDFNLMTMWWEVRQCHCDVERWMQVAKNAGGCQRVVATLYQAQDVLDDLEVELRWLDGLHQPDAEVA